MGASPEVGPGAWDLAGLVEGGSPPVRYRTLRDILGRPPRDPELLAAGQAVAGYRPAVVTAALQSEDGTWGGRIHSSDSRAATRSGARDRLYGMIRGQPITSEVALARLVEYGWGPGMAAVDLTAGLFSRLLGDAAPGDYHELAASMTTPRRTSYLKWFTRSLAAARLAHAGFVTPEVVSVATRLLGAAYRFVTGPVATDPVVSGARGAGPPRLRPGTWDEELGYVAIPDLYLLELFAFVPDLSRNGSEAAKLQTVLDYVASDDYAHLDSSLGLVPPGESRQLVKGWKILLPGPEELTPRGMWSYALIVLEWLARLGATGRFKAATGWLEWLDTGQWGGKKGSLFSAGALFAERVRLAPDWRSRQSRESDVSFRLALIDHHLRQVVGSGLW